MSKDPEDYHHHKDEDDLHRACNEQSDFEEFLSHIPEDRQDIVRMVWNLGKEMTRRDVSFAFSISTDGMDGLALSNVTSPDAAGVLVNSVLLDFHKRGCLPRNISRDDDTSGESWKDPD